MKRWTRDEVRLAKDTLIQTNGHKTQAADIITKATGRSHAAVMFRLCRLTKTYPMLKKKSIKKRLLREVVSDSPKLVINGRVEVYKGYMKIIFA